ncbi:MAG TPA: hypothetical protein VFA71_03840 [Terriglobales bacterium]|nr:hypothetical protein [Terriglobales bacterium]
MAYQTKTYRALPGTLVPRPLPKCFPKCRPRRLSGLGADWTTGQNNALLNWLGDQAQNIQDLVQNAWHGNITTTQAQQIKQDAINSMLSQQGWQNVPQSQVTQIRANLDRQIQHDLDALAAQNGGYADQQGFLPTIPSAATPWLWVAGGVGAVVLLLLVTR